MGDINHQPGSHNNHARIHVLQAVGGGVAGGVMRSCTHSLDVLKIRMQMQVESRFTSKYHGILHGLRMMYVEEGMRGLMKGHNISQVMSITHGLVQFWSYEQLSTLLKKVSYLKDRTFQRHFLGGGFAGCLACTVAHPFDVVRAQAMAAVITPGSNQHYGFRHVYATEGWKGLTRGLNLALLETFPLMGFKFLFYKYLNALTLAVQQRRDVSSSNINGGFMLVNGAVAGGTAKIVVYPFDLLRRRIQLQKFKHKLDGSHRLPDCPTLQYCIATTFQQEGVRGFYKGMAPTLMKAVMANAIYFSIYDLFCRHFIGPLQAPED